MPTPRPLRYVFYFAGNPEKAWQGFVSPESNRTIFMGADFSADLKPGGKLIWSGPGPDGKTVTYVEGEVIRCEPNKVLEYSFRIMGSPQASHVLIELAPESEATKVTVTHDGWAEGDPGYAQTGDGWPRILSRLKTLVETGKTFKPH